MIIVASISSSVAEQPVVCMMQKRPGSISYDRTLHRFRWEVLMGGEDDILLSMQRKIVKSYIKPILRERNSNETTIGRSQST
jgi:hypothetical protein